MKINTSKAALIVTLFLVFSAPALAGSLDNIQITADKDQVEVPGTVEITGETTGTSLNSMQVQRKVSGDWNTIGSTKGCTGSSCTISRTHSRASTGEVQFRIRAAADTGSIDESDVKTVSFVEKSSEPESKIEDIRISTDKEEVEVPGTVSITGEVDGKNLNSVQVRRRTGTGSWTTVGNTRGCTGSECQITRTHSRSTAEDVEFKIRVAADGGETDTSDIRTVEFIEQDTEDPSDEPKVDNLNIDVSSDRIRVPGTVTIDGDASGTDLNSMQVQRKVSGDWNTIGSTKGCTGSSCTISRTHSRASTGEVQFRIRAAADTGDSKTSGVRTVEFYEEDRKQGPVAELNINPSRAETGESITFDASDSYGRDSVDIDLYRYDFNNDGNWDLTTRRDSVSRSFSREFSGYAKIKVVDREGRSDTARKYYRVRDRADEPENKPPVPNLNVRPSTQEVGKTVTFDASESYDPDGRITRYRFDFNNDGNWDRSTTRSTVERSFSTAGSRTARVEVRDNEGATRTTTGSYRITEERDRRDPVARLDIRPDPAKTGETVTFDTSNSYGRDREIRRYRYDFNNNGNWDRITTDSEATRTFNTEGTRTARVQVEDYNGNRDSTTRSYTISKKDDSKQDPVARLDIRPDPAKTGETVTFDASDSYARDGRITQYRYDFENNGNWNRVTTSSSVSTSFNTAGNREARIQVRDSNGNTHTIRRSYSVEEREPSDENANLDVTVRDDDGNRLRDARVHAANGDSKTRYTDRNGEANFRVQPDRYQVTASKSGYSSDSTSIRLRDSDSRSVTLRLGERDDEETDPDIRIQNMDYPDSVCRGESMRVNFDAENSRATSESMKVSGSGLGSISLGQKINLASGETKSTSLLFTNIQGNGEEEFRIKLTNGDLAEETRTVEVEDCAPDRDPGTASGITMNLNPQSTTVGNAVRVSGYVDGVRGRKDLRIDVDGRQAARVNTQPDGYYETFIRPNQVGELTVTASTDSVRQSRTLEVRPTVDVFYANVDDPVFEGESFDVCSDVESQVTPKVILSKDGERVDSKNARGKVCFERTELEGGEYEYEIEALARGSRSSTSTRVNVLETDLETRNFPDQVAQVRSGPSIIRVELYNTEQNLKRYDLELSGLPRDWTDQSDKQVVVRPGERKEAFFYLTPKADGVRTADLKVSHDESVIHDQEIEVRTGGTTKPGKTRLERFLTRLGL